VAYVFDEYSNDRVAEGRLMHLLKGETSSLVRGSLNYRSKRQLSAQVSGKKYTS